MSLWPCQEWKTFLNVMKGSEATGNHMFKKLTSFSEGNLHRKFLGLIEHTDTTRLNIVH